MFSKGMVAILLLLSLWFEVAVDQSTCFVRSYFRTQVLSKLAATAPLADQESDSSDSKRDAQQASADDSSNLILASGAAHSACTLMSQSFSVFLTCTSLRSNFSDDYLEPPLLHNHRPPIA